MKLNLISKYSLTCIVSTAIISNSFSHASNVTVGNSVTYTTPAGNSTSANQENVTVESGGTISFEDTAHLEGNILLNGGSILQTNSGNMGVLWTGTASNTFTVSGEIFKRGTGSLRIDRPITTNGDSTLNIQEGTINFGDATNDKGALGFTHVIVGAGTLFEWFHSGAEVGKFTLNGGTYKHSGQDDVATTMSQLVIARDSTFDVRATGTYNITKLTGTSNLLFSGNDVQLHFNVNTIEDYNGTITTTSLYHDIQVKNINQAAGKTVTITDADGITATEGLLKQGEGTAIITNDLTVTGGDLNVQGGTLQLNAATTVTGEVMGTSSGHIKLASDAASLSLNSASYSLHGASAAGGNISGDSSFTLTSNKITGATLTGLEISVNDNSDLTLSNVTLGKGTTITLGSGSTISVENSQLTGLSVADIGKIDLNTSEGFLEKEVQAYSISGISDMLGGQAASGKLTLNLGVLDNFENPSINGKMFAFRIDDTLINDVGDIVDSRWYGDIDLIINGDTYSVLGVTSDINTGSLMFYIPEPSTATLSILALAGLLARRRRKVTP